MWPFKKKLKAKKTTSKLEKFNVGKTLVRIELEDGTILHKEIKGKIYQNNECKYKPNVDGSYTSFIFLVRPPYIDNSLSVATSFMGSLSSLHYFYDREDKSKMYYSKPKKSEVLSTEDFIIEYNVTYIVE